MTNAICSTRDGRALCVMRQYAHTTNAANAMVWGQGNATTTYTFFSANFLNYWYGGRTTT